MSDVRTSGLRQYDILDTEPEPQFDRIVQMAARLFDSPFAAISFLDADRQWFKARFGFAFADVASAGALCRQTIRADRGTMILDAAASAPCRADPLVAGMPGIRFYAGAGIHAGDGEIIGTLFVADDRPRATPQPHALEELQMLARLAEAEIESRDLRRTLTDAMDRFRDLADVSATWVWETDREHRLVGLFSGHPCMSGIASVEMGKPRWEYRDSRPLCGTWDDHIAAVTARQAFRDMTYAVATGDGEERFFQISGRPVHDSQGRFVGYRGTGSEITERERACARVAEIEARLRHGQKLEALGLLTSGIVHDFNNVLSIITLKLECMADELPPDSPQLPRIDEVLKATGRGAALVSRILAFSNLRSPIPGEVRPDAVVEGLADMLRTAVPAGIDVSIRCGEDLVPCVIDKCRFEAAILNLVVNARDATPCGGRIDIGVARRSVRAPDASRPGLRAGDWIEVSVTDTGAGMTLEVQRRVFEPFFTTKQDHGTGLGLSMVHDFVHQSGGFLTLDSAVGRGTTLSLYLPAAGMTRDAPASAADAGTSQGLVPENAAAAAPSGRTRRRPSRWREAVIAFGRRFGGHGTARRLRLRLREG